MTRFNDYDDEESDDSEEQFDYEDDLDDEDFISDDDFHDDMGMNAIPATLVNQWKQAELEIELQKVNQMVLKQAVSMLERSIFWRFRRLDRKISMIYETYYALLDLVQPED